MPPLLGIIEGYYGTPWSWPEREAAVQFLASHGYGFFIYAPKGDPYLRRQWQQDHPARMAERLAAFGAACRAAGLRFGIGFSPFEVYAAPDDATRQALQRKLSFLDSLGIDDLAILFDDMSGLHPDLAARQIGLVHWMASRSKASRVLVCPTYYSDDPILDRVFGQRPSGYVEALGAGLDPAIEVFWTGEKVCSPAIAPDYLSNVAARLRRKPFLWDNYPVNDGQRMSQHLHLRGFTGRPAENAAQIAGHAINPALQPQLTRLPASTLAALYRQGAAYDPAAAWQEAARDVLGADFAARLADDLALLQDKGLDNLSAAEREYLRERYGEDRHGAAAEILHWLEGAYRISHETVLTQ